MAPILCVDFPVGIVAGLKLKFPDLYGSCHFNDRLMHAGSYGLVVLPVEHFIFQIKALGTPKTIPYGEGKFLEEAFLLGAEDYLKDPWDESELALRIGRAWPDQVLQEQLCRISIAESGIHVNGEFLRLSERETKIFSQLNSNKNSIVSYDTIGKYIGIRSKNYENTLYVTICGLKKKLRDALPEFFPLRFNIENVPSRGYLLKVPVDNLCKNEKS